MFDISLFGEEYLIPLKEERSYLINGLCNDKERILLTEEEEQIKKRKHNGFLPKGSIISTDPSFDILNHSKIPSWYSNFDTLSVAGWNINGRLFAKHRQKLNYVLAFLEDLKPEILMLNDIRKKKQDFVFSEYTSFYSETEEKAKEENPNLIVIDPSKNPTPKTSNEEL